MGECRQFFTTCKKCGRKILMTRNHTNGYWIPCNPELYRCAPSGGPETYVTPEGRMVRGFRDRDGQFGYLGHRWSCGK